MAQQSLIGVARHADAHAVGRRANKRRVSIAGRALRLAAVACAGVVLGVSGYVGLVEAGLLPDPFAPAASGDLALARSQRAGLRVLFVGNSLTAGNSMPALVRELAEADPAAGPLFAVQYTAGGWTLQRATQDEGLGALLEDVRWDIVVLQEQSQLPSFSRQQRMAEMYPYARTLHEKIIAAGARTVLFVTWGHRAGDRRNVPGDSFTEMQARLNQGYSELAAGLPAELAPVGSAWVEALRRKPEISLWGDDGRHPSLSGSYLAACVLYGVLSGRTPAGNSFTAGLESAEAAFLQRVAADVVGV
jgi:hypothetical protein